MAKPGRRRSPRSRRLGPYRPAASRTGRAEERAEGCVEALGRLDGTGVTDAFQDDQSGAGDGRGQGLGYGERGADVLIAAEHQCRYGDPAAHRRPRTASGRRLP